jgi:hypothetical protein
LFSYVALAVVPDLRVFHLLPAIAAEIVILLACVLIAGTLGKVAWGQGTILTLALFFRLLFLFHPSLLSDDIHRYVWDGRMTLAGHNPYSLPPARVLPATPALAALQARVNHGDLVTVYPPAAQLLFAAGTALHPDALGLRILFCLLDLAVCLLITWLLRALGLPAWRAALYAWHPLPIIEVAGSGHVDGAAVCFLLGSFLLLARSATRSRSAAAGAAFAASILTKLLPVLFVPAAFLVTGRRRAIAFGFGALVAAAAMTVPFLPEISHALGTLATYCRHWEFAGFAFRTLRRLTGSGDAARIILSFVFLLACALLYRRHARAKPDPESRLFTALCACYDVVIAFLLLTPTLHPWYAIYLAALLPFAAGPAGIALSASVFLGYGILPRYVTEGIWAESSALAFWITAVPALAFLVWKTGAKALFRRAAVSVFREPPPSR